MTFPNHTSTKQDFYNCGKRAYDAGERWLTACPYNGWQAEAWKAGFWARRSECLASPMIAVKEV